MDIGYVLGILIQKCLEFRIKVALFHNIFCVDTYIPYNSLGKFNDYIVTKNIYNSDFLLFTEVALTTIFIDPLISESWLFFVNSVMKIRSQTSKSSNNKMTAILI